MPSMKGIEYNMKTKDFSFEIAEIKFRYVYAEPIEISENSTIHNFITQNRDDCDVINDIFISPNIYDECVTDGKPIFQAPAWSLYSSFVVFHPNGELIAKMVYDVSFHRVKTYIKDLSFTMHPLPICITGFLLQRILVEREMGFIMHGAVIRIKENAFVLTGNSGVGKSTLSSIFSKYSECERISDDRYILIKKEDGYYAYGNPFDTKAERNLNKGVKIHSIFFLHHAKQNSFERVSNKMKMKKMLTVSMLPYWKKEYLSWSVMALAEITERLNVIDLFFVPSGDIVSFMSDNKLIIA